MTQARDLADGKFDTNTLVVDAANNHVGVGTASPSLPLHINGASAGDGLVYSRSGTEYFRIDDTGTDMNIKTTGGGHQIIFTTNSSEVGRWRNGGGLTFNGDTAAANALDDYEFGNWTPSINFGSNTGSGTGVTYNEQSGNFVKIGNLVHVQCRISLSAKGSSTGSTNITGLPFTSNGGGTPIVPMSCWYTAFTNVTRGQVIIGRIDNNSSGIELRFLDGNSESVLNQTHLGTTANVAISGTYYTTQ